MSPDINVQKSADGKAISLWVDTGPETDFPKLEAAL